MSILDAVARGADLKHFNEKKEPKNNFDAKKADKDLKACPVCNVVWEIMVFNQTLDYKYYHNFPRYGKKKSMLSIGLGCEAKYAKDFVYTENLNLNDKKTEIPIGVSCRTCDRLDCSQRAFPPLHKKFDVDINSRGISVYVTDK